MPFEEIVKEKLNAVFKTSPFNNPYVEYLRSLRTCYGYQINLALTGMWKYPCNNCSSALTEESIKEFKKMGLDSTEMMSANCFSNCQNPIDIKYLVIHPLEIYQQFRPSKLKEKDFIRHKENKPLYEILNPELAAEKAVIEIPA